KPELYARIGVPEYFIFDPEGRYLDAPLLGYRIKGGVYVPLKPAKDGSLVSKELGLRLVPEGAMLRLVDLTTGKKVLTRQEARERAEQQTRRERRRTAEERQRAAELAAEVERLRALLAEQPRQTKVNGGAS